MKALEPPSPAQHPNAYQGGLSGLATGLILYECNTRLGFDLDIIEATAIVAGVTWLTLRLGKKGGKP